MAMPKAGPKSPKMWPTNLQTSDHAHWVQFRSFDFIKREQIVDVALFMPPDALSTSYKSEYESSEVGHAGAKIMQKLSGKEATVGSVTAAIAGGTWSKLSETSEVMRGIISKVTGANAAAVLDRSQGKVANPYIVAAYKGPTQLRDHSFTFKMMPTNETDSQKITEIVNDFKTAMLPGHQGGVPETAPSGLFDYPDEWLIDLWVNGKNTTEMGNKNPLFKIGRSVLTDCTLDYTTQDTSLFFEGTQNPVSIEMKLQFQEIEAIHRGNLNHRITGMSGATS